MNRFLITIEQLESDYIATSADFPGFVAKGKSAEEVMDVLREMIVEKLDAIRDDLNEVKYE